MTLPPRTAGVVATQGVLLGLSWIFVILRLSIRRWVVRKMDWDDAFLFLTLLLYTVFGTAIFITASVHDFSYLVPPLELEETLGSVSYGLHWFFVSEVFYIVTAAFLRVSVGILLLRIAGTKAQRRVIYAILTLMVVLSTAFLFLVIFQCTPVPYYWDENPNDVGTCVSNGVLAGTGYAHAGVSFVADWMLGLLPIWLLWGVRLKRGKKWGIGGLLGLGLLCGIAAIARTPFIKQFEENQDFEYAWVPLALCSIIEPGLGILAASTAALKPLFKMEKFQNLGSKLHSHGRWSGSGKGSGKEKKTEPESMEEGKAGIHSDVDVDVEATGDASVQLSPSGGSERRRSFQNVDL